MECSMIQIIWIIVTFTEIVISYLGHGKYVPYFLSHLCTSINHHKICCLNIKYFSIIQIFGKHEKKQTDTPLLSVIRCVNT
jgi:hypothetical protein